MESVSRNVDVAVVRAFLTVVETGSVTKAARQLNLSQGAISQQIRRLETELGERLLHRDRRTVTLTSAGQALLPHARAALADGRAIAVRADTPSTLKMARG